MSKEMEASAARLQAIRDELDELKTVRRMEVAVALKEARAQGNLSENMAYDAAKEAQRQLEERIYALETTLKQAEIICI